MRTAGRHGASVGGVVRSRAVGVAWDPSRSGSVVATTKVLVPKPATENHTSDGYEGPGSGFYPRGILTRHRPLEGCAVRRRPNQTSVVQLREWQ